MQYISARGQRYKVGHPSCYFIIVDVKTIGLLRALSSEIMPHTAGISIHNHQ
jgi:hypothetical protein